MFKTEAIIHSLAKEDSNKPYDMATIIHEKDGNDVVAEYKGERYTAIFNWMLALVAETYGYKW